MKFPFHIKTRRHIALALLGIGFLLLGIFLPHDWYHPLPPREAIPDIPPMLGLQFLQITFVVEGLLLVFLGVSNWQFQQLAAKDRLPSQGATDTTDAKRDRLYLWLLLGVTLLALILRLISINSDLWLDEITPILDYSKASFLQVISSYISSNNHLLNTLLVNLLSSLFGPHEWAIRLPAALFGVLTIPAFYWVARQLFSRWASLSAALILAVSYHHIFFSQNARGYSAYLFFSLVASGLLVKALREDRLSLWVFYVLTMCLNMSADLIGIFVLTAHGCIGLLALVQVGQTKLPIPLFRRLTQVFGITALLGFQIYAVVVPQIIGYTKVVYSDSSAGYPPFSAEFFQELFRGISSGFGPGLLLGAIPFLLIAGLGFLVLLRRNWPIVIVLLLPPAIHAAFLTVRGYVFSPRFFLLTLLLALLTAIAGIELVADRLTKWLKRGPGFARVLSLLAVAAICIVFVIPLRYYYAVPKQAYRDSLQYVEELRKPGDIVIVIYLAESGYRYYGTAFQIQEGKDYFYVRSIDQLNQVLTANKDKNPILVNTFPRALSIKFPDLSERIQRDWTIVRRFAGTIGDGDISVWEPNTRQVSHADTVAN